jgi:hypothetical protein
MSSTSREDLLNQAEYADAISRRIDGSVGRTWISKATKNEKTVADRFRPDLDAEFTDDRQLVGYQEPRDRSDPPQDSPANAAGSAAQRRNGQHSQNGMGGGGASGDGGTDTRRNPSYRQRARMQAYERGEGLEQAAASLTQVLTKDRATFRSTARVGVTLGSTCLFWRLGNQDVPSAILVAPGPKATGFKKVPAADPAPPREIHELPLAPDFPPLRIP